MCNSETDYCKKGNCVVLQMGQDKTWKLSGLKTWHYNNLSPYLMIIYVDQWIFNWGIGLVNVLTVYK